MTIREAIRIASEAHAGQIDKCGQPYILHPLCVSMYCKTNEEKIVAILHDVVEDTSVTLNDLSDLGLSYDLRLAVDAITKRSSEVYWDYLDRVFKNPIALAVKIEDMIDNADLSRAISPTPEDYERHARYSNRINLLLYCKQNNVFPSVGRKILGTK